MATQSREVVLVLIDISGYTSFMALHRQDQIFAQEIVGKLLKVLIQQAKLPLHVAKLEGDAIFLYASKEDNHDVWLEQKKRIGAEIEDFFTVFSKELIRLSGSKLCTCNKCENLQKLQLKIIIHTGTALFQRIAGYDELAGLDVILAHSLLKNTLRSHCYILVTSNAYNDISFPNKMIFQVHQERYPVIGMVHFHVYLPQTLMCKS